MDSTNLMSLIACYIGVFVNLAVFLLLLRHMILQHKLKKPLYWCFTLQCVIDFASCWVESFDYYSFDSLPLRIFSMEQTYSFFVLSSWITVITALVWKFAFFQKYQLTAGLCLAVSIVSCLILSKSVCSTVCALFDPDAIPAENSTLVTVTLIVVGDTAILLMPLLLNTLVTIGCMVAVLLLPSKQYSGSILVVYRKVSACLVLRVFGILVNVFLILSLVINQVYFYVLIITDEEIFTDGGMMALYGITDWTKPAHLWLYSLNPVSTVCLMRVLILPRVSVAKIYPISRSLAGVISSRTGTAA